MKGAFYYIVLLLWFLSCQSKESAKEQVVSLYEQGKEWEEAAQADSATAYYLRSFKLAKELKEDSLAGEIGNTLGNILYLQCLYNQAISINKEAYLYNNKLKDKAAASHSLRGISKAYVCNTSGDSILYRSRLDSTWKYLNLAKSLIPQIEKQEEIALIYNNLCMYYMEVKEFSKAFEYNQMSIRFTKDSILLYRDYSCLGSLFVYYQQYDSAIYYWKLAMRSSNPYTKYSGCYRLAKIYSLLGSPDSAIYNKKVFELHKQIEQQGRDEEIMDILQKFTQDKLEREKKMIIFGITFLLFFFILWGFMFYRKYNRRKLLKTENIISFQKNVLEKEEEEKQILYKELEKSKQIGNFVELKEMKQEEEARIVSQIIQLGEECTIRFQKDRFYKNIMGKLNEEPTFTSEEQEILTQKVIQYFTPYIHEMSKYFHLADEDYFVCCLTLLGFSTKHCAIFRGVGEAAIRVQRRRIKEKLKGFFHSDKLYNSIFGKK